jgi:Uma2 family endonuclease
MATTTALLTAEEYLALPDNGELNELIRGQVITMNVPAPRHGEICGQIYFLLRSYLENNNLGRVVTNDAGVVIERDPDTVRGADVAFYSYTRVPRGPLPQGYLAVPPDLVFEVRSATDPWRDVHAKVGEYLRANVTVVCVVDEQTKEVHVFHSNQSPQILTGDQELALPNVLGSFRVAVKRFFE